MSNKRIRKKWAKYGRVRTKEVRRIDFVPWYKYLLDRPNGLVAKIMDKLILGELLAEPKFGMLSVTTEDSGSGTIVQEKE